jgi:hypothetical protein
MFVDPLASITGGAAIRSFERYGIGFDGNTIVVVDVVEEDVVDEVVEYD